MSTLLGGAIVPDCCELGSICPTDSAAKSEFCDQAETIV